MLHRRGFHLKTTLEFVRVESAEEIASAKENKQEGSLKMKLASVLMLNPPWLFRSAWGTMIFGKAKLSGFESQCSTSFLTKLNA